MGLSSNGAIKHFSKIREPNILLPHEDAVGCSMIIIRINCNYDSPHDTFSRQPRNQTRFPINLAPFPSDPNIHPA